MAFTTKDDVNILQASDSALIGAGSGDDRYVLSSGVLSPGQTVTISDAQGANTLQLVGGLTITSSEITANALQLTLSDGSIVNVLGADTFSFQTGGNGLNGQGGIIQNFSDFVVDGLGATVPAAGAPATSGGTVTVNDNGGTTGGGQQAGVTLTPAVNSISEDDTLTVTVDIGAAAMSDTVFNFVIEGAGSNPTQAADFTSATAGTVTVPAGATSATFDVTFVNNEAAAEFAETFQIRLEDATGTEVARTPTVTLIDTSTNDREAPVVTMQAGPAAYPENSLETAVLATAAATDNVGVTSFAIASGDANGFFEISSTGAISLTAAGASKMAASNDFETTPNEFMLGITATDAAGNVSAPVMHTLRVTDVDDRAPLLTGQVVNGTSAFLTYDEALDPASQPALADFTVAIQSGGSIQVTSVQISGNTVALTLGRAPAAGEELTLTYTPGANPVQDAAGNAVAAIAAAPLVVDTVAPVVTAGQTLAYTEDLITGVAPTRTADDVIGTVAATDNTGVTAFTIVSGNANGFFAIDSSGNVRLTAAGLAGAANDFEAQPNQFTLTVNATDAAGNVSANQQITLKVNNDVRDDVAPPPPNQIIQMTSGNDNVTPTGTVNVTQTSANNDTVAAFFDGTAQGAAGSGTTIGLGDSFDTAGGTDTLNLTLANGATTATNAFIPLLNNLEILSFISTGAATNTVNLAGFSPASLNTVNFTGSSQSTTVAGIPGSVNTIGLLNTPTAAAALTQTATLAAGVAGGAMDAVTVNLSNNAAAVSGTNSSVLSIEGAAAGANNGYEILNVNSSMGSSRLQALTSLENNGGATALTTLNVNGNANLRLDTAPLFAANTTGVVNAQNFTGALNTQLNNAATFALNVTGGSGNDRFDFAGTLGGAASTINGGGGTDAIAVGANVNAAGALLNAINAATSIEVLEFDVAGTETLDATLLTSIKNFEFSGNASTANVIDSVNVNTFAFTGNGIGGATFARIGANNTATDVLNVSVNNSSGFAFTGGLAAVPYETINLGLMGGTVTGGGQAVTSAAGSTVNITGPANMLLTDGGLSFTNAINVNASAATGNLNLTLTPAGTLTGGSGNDLLLGTAATNQVFVGGAGNDTFTGNTGADRFTGGSGNDTFVYQTNTDVFSTAPAFTVNDNNINNIDQILDFQGNGAQVGDVIQLGIVGAGGYNAAFFNAATVASVTPIAVGTANIFADLVGALGTIAPSSAANAQIFDVTVANGTLAGRYVVINDANAGLTLPAAANGDAIIALGANTQPLVSTDFVFAV